MGCIICDIKRQKIYSIGVNMYGTDLNYHYKGNYPMTIHAEDNAIHKLKPNLKSIKRGRGGKRNRKYVDIIVFRVNPNGDRLLMSKSCNNCLKKIRDGLDYKGYLLKNLYYTNGLGELCIDNIENIDR